MPQLSRKRTSRSKAPKRMFHSSVNRRTPTRSIARRPASRKPKVVVAQTTTDERVLKNSKTPLNDQSHHIRVMPKAQANSTGLQPFQDENMGVQARMEDIDEEIIETKASEQQLAEINELIEQAKKRLLDLTENVKTTADVIDESIETETQETKRDQFEPKAFNGVSNNDEQFKLLLAELEARKKEQDRLKKELKTMKQVYEDEQEHLKSTIRKLTKELHRTAPLTEHKFFSLSTELSEAVEAINKLVENDSTLPGITHDAQHTTVKNTTDVVPAPQEHTKTPKADVVESVQSASKMVVAHPSPDKKDVVEPKKSLSNDDKTDQEVKDSEVEKKPDTPKKKRKKMFITGGAAVMVLLFLSAGLSYKLSSSPQVDTNLVDQYLKTSSEQTGEVQGASTAANQQETPVATATNNEADKYKESQADVSFENSIWEKIKDPMFGLEMEYPVNSVNIIKTDSSITFIRKTGYIFKVNRVETGLDLDDYWKQIQATSLNYASESTTMAGKEAIHLSLQDELDYPGDRYLIKVDDFVYDVWYATGGPKFTADDISRAKHILDSLTFI